MREDYMDIVCRDDGFLIVKLRDMQKFDDYIFNQIQNDTCCLSCIRDYQVKTTFYYDCQGYVSLKDYLLDHVFQENELLFFLIMLFEQMVKVNVSKPIVLSTKYIYLHYECKEIHFLGIPIFLNKWNLQSEEVKQLLEEILFQLPASVDLYIIGFLYLQLKSSMVSLQQMLNGLIDLKAKKSKRRSLIEKLFHLEDKSIYQIENIPKPRAYPFKAKIETLENNVVEDDKEVIDSQPKTQALLQNESRSYLYDVQNQEKIELLLPYVEIGRSSENTIQLDETFVSSKHARIHVEKHIVEDLSSTNGTFVNGHKILSQSIQNNDELMFGNRSFRFMIENC